MDVWRIAWVARGLINPARQRMPTDAERPRSSRRTTQHSAPPTHASAMQASRIRSASRMRGSVVTPHPHQLSPQCVDLIQQPADQPVQIGQQPSQLQNIRG
jgi:hypothetical protein